MTVNPENLISALETVADGRPLFFIADANIMSLPVLRDVIPSRYPVHVVSGGEKGKSPEGLMEAWAFLHANGASRSGVVVNVGGGSVTDLGGFAAATFKRGMDYINVPTTLLALVDASIGGKTGINFMGVKNLVGAFRMPLAVVNVPCLLRTLPSEEILSGYGEMIKCGFLDSEEMAGKILAAGADLNRLAHYIEPVQEIKMRIVEADPLEKGLRRSLNLGHTVGHALESLWLGKGHPVPHGIAVVYGLLVELILSHELLGFPSRWISLLARLIKDEFPHYEYLCTDYENLFNFMRADKKNSGSGDISFALLSDPGKCKSGIIASSEDIRNALDIGRDFFGC